VPLPLRAEELEGLKHPVATHGELNELEAANIAQGQAWALNARGTQMPEMLSDEYVQQLHQRMYGEVWEWAGKYRLYDSNIGVTHTSIRTELRVIFDDARYWVAQGTYAPDEFVIRLHHRLVWVQPFANGNGRHARMMADLILMRHFKENRLSWGGTMLGSFGPRRVEYIAGLRAADAHDYAPLLRFCRSSQ
jgi:Fic-DOC domain mobile mystery protein B